MPGLKVQIEYQGAFVPVGDIIWTSDADAVFVYENSYMKRDSARPVSVSLPFQKDPFSPGQTRNYFEGLLPEGYTRMCIAEQLSVDGQNYLSVLKYLGRECLGALKITEEGVEEEAPGYTLLTHEELKAFAREGAMKSAQLVIRSHLSLTGASGKTGLYLNPSDGRWYLPHGTAPSTHIVKQSHIRLKNIVANEMLCLHTARKLGIDVSEFFMVPAQAMETGTELYATRRYDRVFLKNTKRVSGLPAPVRLHQEDFAQALGIPAAGKYERNGEHYLKQAFDLLRNVSSDPIRDQLKLWDICIFNYLIGNTDNHIKNFSLLYSVDMQSVRLAPAYDIVSTLLYEGSTENMAVSIGGEYNIRNITRESFESEAKSLGLGVKPAMHRFDDMHGKFDAALLESMAELSDVYPGLELQDACERILKIHKLRL